MSFPINNMSFELSHPLNIQIATLYNLLNFLAKHFTSPFSLTVILILLPYRIKGRHVNARFRSLSCGQVFYSNDVSAKVCGSSYILLIDCLSLLFIGSDDKSKVIRFRPF